MARNFREIEDRFIGQMRGVEQAGNRRHERHRAGGNDEAARLDRKIADGDGARIGKARRTLDDADAEAGQALARRVRRERADDVAHVRVDGGEIDGEALGLDAEGAPPRIALDAFGRRDQRLRRHAAAVEAFAAHAALFDEHGRHADAKPRPPRRQDRRGRRRSRKSPV